MSDTCGNGNVHSDFAVFTYFKTYRQRYVFSTLDLCNDIDLIYSDPRLLQLYVGPVLFLKFLQILILPGVIRFLDQRPLHELFCRLRI